MLGQPIFPGDSGVDQLVEIIKVLGTPTREQIKEMNPNYTEFKFPQIKAHPWPKVFRARTSPEAIDLVSRLLEYTPSARISPLQACAHSFFDELRESGTKLPNGRDLPQLFNFTEQELKIQPSLNSQLLPAHLGGAADAGEAGASGVAGAGQQGAADIEKQVIPAERGETNVVTGVFSGWSHDSAIYIIVEEKITININTKVSLYLSHQ